MVLGELGKLPLAETIRSRVLLFWFKIVTNKNKHKLSCIMYQLARKMFNSSVEYNSKWITYVKTSLEDLGLSFVWITQGTLDKSQQTWFKNTVNRQIKDRFITVWRAGTEASPNCINYRLFKSMFECELYIKKLPTFLAISLMKFRCRNTKLPVVKLRYDNLVYSPECTLCDSGEIGDEFHVLLKCPFLKEERRKLLGK